MELGPGPRRWLASLLVVPALLLAACGDDDEATADPGASESPEPSGAVADDGGGGGEADEAGMCGLATEEEISEATGLEVVDSVELPSAMPSCEWTLALPDGSDLNGMPGLKIEFIDEADYATAAESISGGSQDGEGTDGEVTLHLLEGPAYTPTFAVARLGDHRLRIMPGLTGPDFGMWDDVATGRAALLELATKILERA